MDPLDWPGQEQLTIIEKTFSSETSTTGSK